MDEGGIAPGFPRVVGMKMIEAGLGCGGGPDGGMPLLIADGESAANVRADIEIPVEFSERLGGLPGFAEVAGDEELHVARMFVPVEDGELIVLYGDAVPATLASFGVEGLVGCPGFAVVGGFGVAQAALVVAIVEPDEMKMPILVGSDVEETVAVGASVVGRIGAGSPGFAVITGDCRGEWTTAEGIGAGRHPHGDEVGIAGSDLWIHAAACGVGVRLTSIDLDGIAPSFAAVGGVEVQQFGFCRMAVVVGGEEVKMVRILLGDVNGVNAAQVLIVMV